MPAACSLARVPPSRARCTSRDPAARIEQLREFAEALRLERLEREVLELPLDLPDPEALRQRRVDLQGLAGDAPLLLRGQSVQRAHVVQPVGELDEDDPDVLRHREQHLADVLGLLLLVAVGREPRQLGHAVDQVGDLGAKPFLDVGQAVLRVLGDVMEQRGLDRDRVDPELREDLGARDRVGDVWLPSRALLAGVRFDCEVERTVDTREVRVGVMLRDRRLQRGPQDLEVDRASRRGWRDRRGATWPATRTGGFPRRAHDLARRGRPRRPGRRRGGGRGGGTGGGRCRGRRSRGLRAW